MSALGIFAPQKNQDFLVDAERVLYDERYHSAVLLRPAFELLAVTMVAAWAAGAAWPMRTWPFTCIMVAACAYLAVRARRYQWSRVKLGVTITAVVFTMFLVRADVFGLAVLAIVWFGLRFALRWLRWRFYRRLLVTDRRVIEVKGLVGSDVASMPLFRVTDALLRRSFAAEVLNYAEFRIESAGQNQALGRISYLDHWHRFHVLVIELSTTAKTDIPAAAADDLGNAIDRLL